MVSSSSFFILPEPAILLLNLGILGTGAQSVTTNRDIRRSNSSNKYEGVQQQCIIKC